MIHEHVHLDMRNVQHIPSHMFVRRMKSPEDHLLALHVPECAS